jgi:hypothetical protein
MLTAMVWWRRAQQQEIERATIEAVLRRNVGLAARLAPAQRERLIELTTELARDKTWEGVGGVRITDEVRVTIAANAALPILAYDTWPYRQVKSIIVRPTTTITTGRRAGPVAGTFTDEPMHLVGEAAPNNGPLAFSWDTVVYESRHPGHGGNVVIHEFAHKIDMNDGFADGVPPLRGEALDQWRAVLVDEYERTESRESDAVLRPYAWASPAEFFAVSTETFFCLPGELAEAKPALYAALRDLYQQHPAEFSRSAGASAPPG